MRDRLQLELNPGEYHDAKKRERQRILLQLERELERAYNHRAPWYMWILWRRNGEHHHGLYNEKSEPVACPVPGCNDGHPAKGLSAPPSPEPAPRSSTAEKPCNAVTTSQEEVTGASSLLV